MVAAFVVKLHEKAKCNEIFHEKKHTNGKLFYKFDKNPIKAWIQNGALDYVGTIIDEIVISRLRDLQELNDGIEFTQLDELELDSDYKVKIRWDGRNYTELVPWKTLRLIGTLGKKRSTRHHHLKDLHKILNNKNQFICFLSGAGGTGKSRVLNGMRHYCKLLCNQLGVEFNKRTIVITAVTGSAAVTIHRETMHSACSL